jgi:hypothetical protein
MDDALHNVARLMTERRASMISLGQMAYEAYAQVTRAMPNWAELPTSIRDAWEAAALAVAEGVRI